MKLTYFERSFLQIKSLKNWSPDDNLSNNKNEEIGFNPLVIQCFRSLLIKAENNNRRKWTLDLLRNYIDASYSLCTLINNIRDNKLPTNIKKARQTNGDRNEEQANDEKDKDQSNDEKDKKKSINIYEEKEPEKDKAEGDSEDKDDDKKPRLKVFFTGLYTPDTYCGQKNGLYFVHNGDKNIVMTREEILDTNWGAEVLNKINHRDSYENELPIDKIDCINIPEVIKSSEAEKYIGKSSEDVKYIKGDEQKYHWLHILKDGIDNIPNEFVKSFFNRPYINFAYNKEYKQRKDDIIKCVKYGDGSFECYQEIIIESIKQQSQKCRTFPTVFYKEGKRIQYLMPVYLLNSDKPDFCIILGKKDKDKDKGKDGETRVWEPITSLNMDEAYCDILVFGTDAVRRVDWW